MAKDVEHGQQVEASPTSRLRLDIDYDGTLFHGWARQPQLRTVQGVVEESLAKRLNGIAGLDTDVWVSRSALAPAGFDARFSATWRRYEYRVADASAPRKPIQRLNTLWYPASSVTLCQPIAVNSQALSGGGFDNYRRLIKYFGSCYCEDDVMIGALTHGDSLRSSKMSCAVR